MLPCLQLTCRVESPGRTVTHKVPLIANNDKLLPAAQLLWETCGHRRCTVCARGGWDDEGGKKGKITRVFVKVIHSYLRRRVCDAAFVIPPSNNEKLMPFNTRLSG